MFCPNCGQEQFCDCKNCQERNPQLVTQKWLTGNGPVACGKCGLTLSVDDWENIEWYIVKWKEREATNEDLS